MTMTYRAMQVSQPGVLELVTKPVPTPKPDEVLLNVASIWKKGQRVGVGRMGGHCLECSECRHSYL